MCSKKRTRRVLGTPRAHHSTQLFAGQSFRVGSAKKGRGGWAGTVLDGLEPFHGNTHPPTQQPV